MHAPPLASPVPAFRRSAPDRRRGLAVSVAATLIASLLLLLPGNKADAAPTLLSQGKPVTASSTENAGTPATGANDGNTGTRWSSAASDPQWIQVDLGSTVAVNQVVLNWETAYAKAYRIELSTNGTSWTQAYATTTSAGGVETLTVSGNARYVRVTGTVRATQWGYSLWEFQVFGGTDGGTGNPLPGGGDLGPNVIVFDPSTPNIQGKLDQVFQQQESDQFGSGRYQFLFKPGTYNGLNAQLGFYTSISGLGLSPDDTNINGDITVDAGWFNGNATQNFWRSAENLAVNPVNGTNRWAVAQAAPFRRMHVKGGLNLAPNGFGWASGGYIADSKIDGTVGPYSQQQWYTRDSSVGGWTNGVWNMVFSGVEGAPAQGFPNPPYTTLNNTPTSREKPFLYLDGNTYKVFAPAKRTNARGTTWGNGTPQGQSVPLDQFYVVKPGATAATINQALAQGLNLLFTPGVYHINQTINVNRANTIVLGLGLATIIPDNGVTAMKVADVDGVKLAGFLIDAGPVNSPTLLEVGPQGASADHSANPTTVQDVFIRIGGAGPGKATTSMVINSDDTIIDHTWIWRADHGAGVGWETNRADYGLRVNGDDVLATGLFVEHFNKYDVEWYGENGRTIFFQNEKAYDAPNQAAIQNGSIRGYAAYKVADSVNNHEGWGLGSYCNYTSDPNIIQEHGFQAPVKPGVKFHDLLVVSLGGMGQYNHVINSLGSATSGTSTIPSTITSFP
ncbi:discoidin domain-containing protein [Streptomyces liangshanensis]|uniref:Discoidin domain-containing protein n=1 Tax=Streptomyces liangshanensis TaxID=2717324 RepID=A0A6G9H723_9ACTN|nr:discoidin domain-containing protein [Streptomyces liangshanensis]QIQ06333.1 discoidin domain-containing protein [Streptomyces liangshanensis]